MALCAGSKARIRRWARVVPGDRQDGCGGLEKHSVDRGCACVHALEGLGSMTPAHGRFAWVLIVCAFVFVLGSLTSSALQSVDPSLDPRRELRSPYRYLSAGRFDLAALQLQWVAQAEPAFAE